MFEERAIQICAELIARRVVHRDEFPELIDEPLIQEDVKRRLSDVGMAFIDKTGVPYVGVVIRDDYLANNLPNDLGMDIRSMAMLLRCWLLLVAPHVYTSYMPPQNLSDYTITETTLRHELPGYWHASTFSKALRSLLRNKFLERAGEKETYSAGAMLWLAIDHDELIQQLKKEGVKIAVERYKKEQAETNPQ